MLERMATAHAGAFPATPAPVWEGIAAQITLPNQPLMAAFILISLVTYMRPSELLALRKKDLVPPLMPLLPCWSVVIAAFETGVSSKTGVRDGRSSWTCAGFDFARGQGWRSRRADLELLTGCFAAEKMCN